MELPNEAPAAEAETTLAPETQEQATPDPAPVAAEATPQAQAQPEPQHPFWYRKEIEKERKRAAQLERQLEIERSQRPQTQRQAPPDPLENPDAFYGHIEQRLETQRVIDRLERSEDRFIDKHGEQSFEEVRDWLATRPDIEQWAIAQRDPWRAAHQQYTREKMVAEIGDDPKGYEARLREKILAELQESGGAAPPGQPQMRPHLPGSAAAVRNARDPQGRFTGPAPLNSVLKNG